MRTGKWLIWPLLLLLACGGDEHPEDPIARAYDQYLYPSDILELIQEGMSPEDSAKLVQSFIESWIRKEVLIHLAQQNLSEAELDLEKELENYRSSLLIYKYQEKYLSQKMDTIVPESEILEYYKEHENDFILNSNIVKALFIQLPRSAPNPERVSVWYNSDKEKDVKKLDEYCNKYAFKFDDFKGEWMLFEDLLKSLPDSVSDQEQFLKLNKNLEVSDSSYYYFVRINEFRTIASPAPLEFARQSIVPILLAKRKVDMLKNLENSLYNDALNKEDVEILEK